jgi:hypothetical protein
MPTRKEHIDKAKHNEQFYSSFDLNTTPFLDWVVNGIFYSALHYLDSYFAGKAGKGRHPGDHKERIKLIWAYPDLGRSFFRLYMHLKDDSEAGRYDTRVFAPDAIRRDIIPKLNDIKTHLKRYLPEI